MGITLLNILCGTLYVIICLILITVCFMAIGSIFYMLCFIVTFIKDKFIRKQAKIRIVNENGIDIIEDI